MLTQRIGKYEIWNDAGGTEWNVCESGRWVGVTFTNEYEAVNYIKRETWLDESGHARVEVEGAKDDYPNI